MQTVEIFGKSRCTSCGHEFSDQDLRENIDNNTGMLCGCGAHNSIETYWDFEEDEFTFTDDYDYVSIVEEEFEDMINWGSNPGYFDFERFDIDSSDWFSEEEEEEFEFEIILYNHFLLEESEFAKEKMFIIKTGGKIIDERNNY